LSCRWAAWRGAVAPRCGGTQQDGDEIKAA
jgi:hypothetical protein